MNIHFSGQNIEITAAIENHIRQKFKVLEKHFDSIVVVEVNLKVEKTRHFAEARVEVRGSSLFASTQQSDMYAAIDALAHKLDRQIIKHKEKYKSRHSKDVTHHMLDK